MRLLKRSVSILLTLTMMIGILVIIPLEASAATGVSYIYRYWDSANQKVVDSTKTCSDYSTIGTQKDLTIGNGKWYVVNGDASISNRVTVTGTANVILLSGTLTCKDGIRLSKGNTLNIYPGKSSEGTLTAKIRSSDNANIGGNENETCGKLNFYGGTLNAENDGIWTYGAAIGGGEKGGAGDLSFYGGKVNAKNTGSAIMKCSTGAAIGSGGYENNKAPTGSVNIYGGEIKAICSGYSTAAGIGGGEESKTPVINILGGKVTAKGSEGAGIGSGQEGTSDTITIRNAEIDAESDFGAGIGSGEDSDSKSIIIEDSYVKAKTIHEGSSVGSEGAGIGGGNCGASKSIVIKGSIIIASSGTYGAGIGGGDESDGGDITIDNSIVFACSGKGGAGIGGGDEKGCNSITLKGSYVIAMTNAEKNTVGDRILSDYKDYYDGLLYSSNPFLDGTDASYNAGFLLAQVVDSIIQGTHTGAAIGGGDSGTVNKIHIENCVVGAESGECAAAIGGGDNGGFGTIEIVNSNIVAVSGDYGAAIGSGDEAKKCGTITIKDSEVTAEAGTDAAGIGTGNEAKESATINITGSTITAHGGRYGAGIGGGDAVSGGTINITDSTIKEADSKTDGAGIGGGESGSGGTITIKNSSVTAHGGGYAAGIGGGDHANGGIVTIDNSTVKAYGGTDAAGIGGGEDGNGGKIYITNGSNVYAQGKDCGAGIGGGEDSNGEYCQITNNSKVEAISGGYGNAQSIGHGDCGWYIPEFTGGTLSLGISEKVKVGSVSYTGNNRFDAIRNNKTVTVYPCDHTETEWRCENAGYHVKYCTNCGYRFGTTYEAHVWNSNNICKVCGASANSATITIVERNNNGEIITETKVPQYINTTLPECKNVPDGMEFAYWIVDSNYFSVPGADIHYVGDTMLKAAYLPVVNAAFIDADGIEKTETARKITEENLQYNDILLTSGWYYIESDITTTKTIYIHGHVNLIIADGKTLKFDNYEPSAFEIHPHYPSSTLSIYGQSKQSGTLNCYARPDVFYNFKQYGGIVKVPYFADFKNALTIESGSFTNETYVQAPQGVTISGGSVNLEEIKDSGDIQLGWRTLSDSIKINSIYKSGTVRIVDGQKMTDGKNVYSGTLTEAQIKAIQGKILTPYVERSYNAPEWKWDNEYREATAVFRSNDGSDVQEIKAKATYEDSGNNRKATARCLFNGQEYKTTQTFRIIFDVTVAKTQNGKVTANKTTAMVGDNIKLDVTPDDGYILSELYYTDSKGKKTAIDGSSFTMPEGSVTVNAVFETAVSEHTHTYNSEPVWKWSSDHSNAQLVYPCTADGCDEGIAYDANVVTYSEGEKYVYMAMVYLNGQLYTDTYSVDHIHTYGEPEWQWSEDLSSVKANFYCTKSGCGNFEVVNAAVTAKHETGKLTFTAVAQFEGRTYTDKKELSCQYFARKEPYIDDKGEYIIGNVEYYVIDGKNYSVDLSKSVVKEIDNVLLSYFDFMLWGSTYVVSHYTGSYDMLENDELVIPKSFNGKKITRIGAYDSYHHAVFMNAGGTKKDFTLVLNENITDIGDYAFTDTTVTKVIGDTSSLRYIGWKAFAWEIESPDSMLLDIRLDNSGTIDTDRFAFEHRDVTIHMKHSAAITKDREWGWWEKSEKYIFTDAHTYGEPVWDWDEDYIGATVTRTCTHQNCKHTESVLAEFVETTDGDGVPYTEAVAKFSDAVYHDVQPIYITEAGDYIVEVTGRFRGGVDSGKHNLVGIEGFRVVFKDKNGNKVDAPQYIWVAQESASEGIVVDPNGDVSFTKEGDFHVQLRSPDGNTVYSPWITVRAYRGGDDGGDEQSSQTVNPKDDMPKTGAAAPTAIAVILLTSLSAALFLVVKRRRNEDEA